MKRKIIEIDEALCNGCGACITGCSEGALKLVDGKAKLVKEQYCDGFGDCIGHCPTGALKIVERESDVYDPGAAREHVFREGGSEAVRRFNQAAMKHGGAATPAAVPHTPAAHSGGGCPGTAMRMGRVHEVPGPVSKAGGGQAIRSELQQWPVQLHLVQPGAPFFKNKEMVVLSTCAPIASADVHWRFIRGRSVVVACPKLDVTDGYVDKLAAILSDRTIPSVAVVRMSVPCCSGLTAMVKQAAALTGRDNLEVKEVVIDLEGNVNE